MISLLNLLHAIAARRGDGLRPELRRDLPKLDADELTEQVNRDELAELPGDPMAPRP